MSCVSPPVRAVAMTASVIPPPSETAHWFAGKMERNQADSFLMEVNDFIMFLYTLYRHCLFSDAI